MPVQHITPGIQVHSASISPFVAREGTTQTFAAGAIVAPDPTDANRLEVGLTNPINIAGIAALAATGTAGANMPYYPALPGMVFEGSVDNTGAGTGVIAAGDLFEEYGLTVTAGGIWYIDKDKSGVNRRVKIIGFRDAVAVVTGRVWFIFLPDVTIFAST